MLNFYQWCKTPSSAFRKKISATTPNFLHVFGRAPSDLQLRFVQLKFVSEMTYTVSSGTLNSTIPYHVQLKTLAPSARYSTFKYPVTLKPGLGSLKVIENYTNESGTDDFLLTFHSHHRPISHPFRDIGHFRRKSPIFPTPRVHIAPR